MGPPVSVSVHILDVSRDSSSHKITSYKQADEDGSNDDIEKFYDMRMVYRSFGGGEDKKEFDSEDQWLDYKLKHRSRLIGDLKRMIDLKSMIVRSEIGTDNVNTTRSEFSRRIGIPHVLSFRDRCIALAKAWYNSLSGGAINKRSDKKELPVKRSGERLCHFCGHLILTNQQLHIHLADHVEDFRLSVSKLIPHSENFVAQLSSPGEDPSVETNTPSRVENLDQSSPASIGLAHGLDSPQVHICDAACRNTTKSNALKKWTSILLQSEQLRAVIRKLLKEQSESKVVETLRRTLKSYYLDLTEMAQSEERQATVKLIRSRRRRDWMARGIVARAQPHIEDKYNKKRGEGYARITGSIEEIEDWLTDNVAAFGTFPARVELAVSGASVEPDSQSSDDEPEGNTVVHPTLVPGIEDFAFRGVAFQRLLLTLQSSHWPKRLQKLRKTIASLPLHNILFTRDDDQSIGNRLKRIAEDLTGEEWDWWPLSPPTNALKKAQIRVLWKCRCNKVSWEDIDSQFAEELHSILALDPLSSPLEVDSPQPCGGLRRYNGLLKLMESLRYGYQSLDIRKLTLGLISDASKSSTNSDQSTDLTEASNSGIVRESSASASALSHSSSIEISSNSSKAASSVSTANTSIDITQADLPGLYVFFGVGGCSETLDIAQIDTKAHNTDVSFFKKVSKEYKARSPLLKRLLSVWTFDHCDFVKFQKICADNVISLRPDLPTCDQYEYWPRLGHPDAENPPIYPREFAARLYPCQNPCVLKILVKHCCPVFHGDAAIQKIPKRKTPLEIKLSSSEYFWGLEAKHKLRFWRLCIYHLISGIGPVVFCKLWLQSHPDDFNTAFAPMSLAIAMLALFWGVFTAVNVNGDQKVKAKHE